MRFLLNRWLVLLAGVATVTTTAAPVPAAATAAGGPAGSRLVLPGLDRLCRDDHATALAGLT
ncbi:MAG TPA: hypothetical protein VMZ66_00070, partial [Aeromicrobium sp.]|nr:hypothetical protein [Aeromicrobium sp.]